MAASANSNPQTESLFVYPDSKPTDENCTTANIFARTLSHPRPATNSNLRNPLPHIEDDQDKYPDSGTVHNSQEHCQDIEPLPTCDDHYKEHDGLLSSQIYNTAPASIDNL
jgi:hypothetical protein